MADLMEIHAREIARVPEGYALGGWSTVAPYDNSPGINMIFARTNGVFERGKRKGMRRFHKGSARCDITVFIAKSAHSEWLVAWEVKTGQCHVCQGAGQRWAGWSADEGTKSRPCERCSTSGKVPTHLAIAS